MCDAPRVLLAAEVPCVGGAMPGDVTRVDVGVGWGDGGRSGRGAVWGVEVVRGAVRFGVSWLRGLTSSHPPRLTEAPGSEYHGSSTSGDSGSVGGGWRGWPCFCRAWMSWRSASPSDGERRCWGTGEMLSSGSADLWGAVGVAGWFPGAVDIGWGPTHGVLVSRGVTQNSTNTCYLALGTPW